MLGGVLPAAIQDEHARMASGYAVTTANGTNSITLSPPVGKLFFRLANH